MISQYINDNDPWMLAEDIPGSDLFFFQIPFWCFVNRFEEQTGRAYNKVLAHFEGYHMWFYFGEQDSFEVGERIVNRIIENPSYGVSVNTNIISVADKLRAWCETIPIEKLDSLSDKELWNIYNEHFNQHSEFYTWVWIGNAADMFHTNFTNRLKSYLINIGVNEEKVNECLVTITTPIARTPVFVEQQNLLAVADEIYKDELLKELCLKNSAESVFDKLPARVQKLLQEHWVKYHYTKFIFVAGEYSIIDYIKQIQEILRGDWPPQKIMAEQIENLQKAEENKQKLIKKLKLEPKWKQIFEVFGDFMMTKIYRRYAQLFALHRMDKVLKEIAKRKFLTLKQVKFMLKREVEQLLLNNVCDPTTLLARANGCVYYVEKGFEEVYVGEEAEALVAKTVKEIDDSVNQLKGEVGCPGYAKGRVKIIIRAEDMHKMDKGDILVSIATDPDIVPAMKKAAAIVTEQGGVTSHAAIVSRELGIPCVIGTKVATKVFKDGDLIEVNANSGVIKKI